VFHTKVPRTQRKNLTNKARAAFALVTAQELGPNWNVKGAMMSI
jgi:hypothetical protein